MKCRRDYGVLLIRNVTLRGLTNKVVRGEIWTDRDVVPRHEPKARHVDVHVIVPETSTVPGRIIRRPFNHGTPCVNRHTVSEDSVRAIDGFDDVRLGQMTQGL